ncbi:MAG: hypothetical protein GX804_11240, partial [Lentisphaerae bacterium]|nr:hypothetical protein [Lentisphaerota bacterium]
MPRASRYMIEGYTYLLTHRCHNKHFLLSRRGDRNAFRKWLWKGVQRCNVSVYGYCITCNHIHVIARADDKEAISAMMGLASGATGQALNIRTGREGSVWNHPYHCTMIQNNKHLLNCMQYVDLNMVRAGAVNHPQDWRWCGYDELSGKRTRYRILDLERLAVILGLPSVEELQRLHCERVAKAIASKQMVREAHWTESLAIGDEAFIENASKLYGKQRLKLENSALPNINTDDVQGYALKEPSSS